MPFFHDLTRNLLESLPPEMQVIHGKLERTVRDALQTAFSRMELVTREEFDVQTAVLQRTREKVTQLEARLDALCESASQESASKEPSSETATSD